MTQLAPTDIERESLDAHVSICALRYQSLDIRLTTIEEKVESVSQAITDSKDSLNKVIIAAAGTIVSSLIGLIITIIMKF